MSKVAMLSKLAANRAEFYLLLSDLERIAGRELDDWKVTAEIDSEVPGRDRVSASETRRIMRAIR